MSTSKEFKIFENKMNDTLWAHFAMCSFLLPEMFNK